MERKTDTDSRSSVFDKYDVKYTKKKDVIIENKIEEEIEFIGENEDEEDDAYNS